MKHRYEKYPELNLIRNVVTSQRGGEREIIGRIHDYQTSIVMADFTTLHINSTIVHTV